MARRRSTTPLGRSVLELDADDSRFHSKLSGARIAAEKWTDQTGASLQRAGKAIKGVGDSWTRNVTLPIVAGGAAAAKVGLDFDTTFRQIVGLTDVTGDQVDDLKEKVLALGPAVGKGPNELAEALYFIVSAGFDADEAMDVLDTSARAAAAGLGETQVVAQVLGSVLNAYGKENLKAADAAGILTEAVSQGTAEADAFAGVVGRVVPAAANLGVSFDQVTAALAGMTLTGLSAEEAAVGLNQVFISLLKPTAEAEKALSEMGLSAEGLRRQLREEGLLATLRTLEDRFGANEQAAAQVFGNVRALRTVTALLGLETDQLNAIFEKTASSGAARLAQAYENTEGPQRRLDRAMASLEATAISLGADVLPIVVEILEALAEGAQDVGEWWRSLDDDTRSLIVQVLAFTAAAGPALIIIGKLTTGAGLLLKAIHFLTGAKGIPLLVRHLGMAGLLGILIAISVAGEAASRAFGDFVTELIHGKEAAKAVRDLREQLSELGDMAPLVASKLGELGVSSDDLSRVIEAAGGDVEAAARALVDSAGDVAVAIGMLRQAQGGLVDDDSFEEWDRRAQRAMHGVADGVTDVTADLPPEVAAILGEGAGVVGEGAEDMLAQLEQEAAQARAAAVAEMQAMLGQLANLFETDETLREAFQALLERMDDPYTEAERKADIFGKNTIAVIRGALKSGDPLIVADTLTLVNDMLEQFEAMEPGALASGQAVPPAIRGGMDTEIGALLKWVETNVTGEVLTNLSLEEAEQLGLDGLWLYAQGIKKRERDVLDAALAAQRAALKPLEEGVVPAGRTGTDTGSAFGGGISAPANLEKARTAGAALATAAGRSAGSAWNFWQGGYDVGNAWTVGLRTAMYDAADDVGIAMGHIRALMGGSLPTEGPLQHPDTGGRSIGEAWGGALVGSIFDIRGDALRATSAVADAMTLSGLDVGNALLPGLSTTAATLAAGGFATGTGLGATSVAGDLHQHWHLEVDGVPKTVSSEEEAMDVLRELALFGTPVRRG